MNIEAAVEQEATEGSDASAPFPKTWWGKVLQAVFIIFVPAFLFYVVEALIPEWQTGNFSDYVILLLFPEASLLFMPLLVYAVVCYGLLLISPQHYAESFIVRLGIYTGTLLAVQYCVVIILASLDGFAFVMVPLWLSWLVLPVLYRWAVGKWRRLPMNVILLALAAVIIVVYLPLLFVLLMLASPFGVFLLAIRVSRWLLRNHETGLTRSRALGLTGWLAGYAAAWRFDILKMYELYAALPPQPPDCYIATAAAHGHPAFVKAQTVKHANGKSMQVNEQLQMLKCAELALKAVHPSLHKVLRRIYDVVGRAVAQRMRNSFVADLAYLGLKPFEWLARWLLRSIIPDIDSISKRMYLSR